jgi:signal transduction histidine kinase
MPQQSTKIKGPLHQFTFWIFFVAMLLIVFLVVFVDELFSRYQTQHLSPKAVHTKVKSTLVLVRTSLPQQYPFIVDLLKQRGMQVRTAKQQPNQGYIISASMSVIEAMTGLVQHPGTPQVSIQLLNGRWLTMMTRAKPPTWIFVSEIVATLVGVGVIFLLAYGFFFGVTAPLRLIANACDRLGVDMNAPRLVPIGSAMMRKLIRAFNHMQQRMQKLLRDRSQMLAAISHDLRTPITRLQLRAEFIEDKNQYDKTLEDLADMERMIASILAFCKDYTQVEGKSQLDLSALVESIVDDFQEMGKPVTLKEDGNRHFYFGRMSALRRAVTNVIENALKYGKVAHVQLSQKRSSEYWLKITDEGPGIPENELAHVFEPFYRCDPARSPAASGSGLGLSVVKEIIDAHGGHISLINLAEGGLRVEILLPPMKD